MLSFENQGQRDLYKLIAGTEKLSENYFDEMELRTPQVLTANPSLELLNKSSASQVSAIYIFNMLTFTNIITWNLATLYKDCYITN